MSDHLKDVLRRVATEVATGVARGTVFQVGVRTGNAVCNFVAKSLGFKVEDEKKK